MNLAAEAGLRTVDQLRQLDSLRLTVRIYIWITRAKQGSRGRAQQVVVEEGGLDTHFG